MNSSYSSSWPRRFIRRQVLRSNLLACPAEYLSSRLGELIAFCPSLARNPLSGGHQRLRDLVTGSSLGKQSLRELKHSGLSFAGDRVDFLADSRLFVGELKPFRFSAATSRPLN